MKVPIKPAVLFAVCFLCYVILIFPLSPYRRNATITDVLLIPDANTVTVFARLTDCFTPKMQSAILAGVPTTFTFFVELYQERLYWTDTKIASAAVKKTIRYDSVKKVFYVITEGDSHPSIFQDFESAKNTMTDISGVVITAPFDFQSGESYYVMMKAKLDKITLPMHMEYILFFISLWDFETDWYRQKVII